MTTKQLKRPDKSTAKTSATKPDIHLDPRMQARRDEVVEESNRRQKRTVLALLVVTVLAIGSMVLVQSSILDVDQIIINGAVNSDPIEVQATAGILRGDPLLELDLQKAAQDVRQLPWVRDAVVERGLNGNVTILIQERVATSAIPTEGGYVLVDSEGRQLQVVAELPSSFMPISGIESSGVVGTPVSPLAQSAMHLVALLPEDLSGQISGVTVEDGKLSLSLFQGGGVMIGSSSGLSDKIVSLSTMLQRVDLRCLAEIDLRVPSAPALTRVSSTGEVGASLTNLVDCS